MTLPASELVLARMEEPPWSALYRTAIGFLIIPGYYHLVGIESPPWHIYPWFLCVLLALRCIPIVMRKVLPTSEELKGIWHERRQLAKQHDSYQWRKLTWFGIGCAMYQLVTSNVFGTGTGLALFCLLTGALGEYFWRRGLAVDRQTMLGKELARG
jgi:hypothetical protein